MARIKSHKTKPPQAKADPLLQLLGESVDDYAAFTVDNRGRIATWSQSASRIFGHESEEIIGKPFTRLYPRKGATTSRLARCLEQSAKSDRCEGWWLRKDRSIFWGYCRCRVLVGADNRSQFGVVIQDRTAATAAEDNRRILGSIVENSEDAIISKDLHSRVLSWNKSAEHLFGYKPEEIIGMPITLLIPSERVREERKIIHRLKRGKRIEHYETVRVRKDGQLISVSISVSPIRGMDGKIIGASKIVRDITRQKQVEEAHRQSEGLLRAILDTATDAIITIDERGIIRSTNAATQSLFGYPHAELIGQNVSLLMPQPYQREHDSYVRKYVHTGHAKIIGIGREVTGLRKDGSTFPMHLSVSEVRFNNQRLFTGIVHDLTERRRLERQIMETAANEQRRIGQDLHDGLCQDLVGIAFSIDAIARNPSDSSSKTLSQVASAVREAASQARRLAHGLNPVDLKAGGLPGALENLAAKVSDAFHVDCTFKWDHLAQVVEDAAATHLYRIAQEATGNAIRHGKATSVEIHLGMNEGSIVLSVSDNGKGIPDALADSVKQGLPLSSPYRGTGGGMGLQTMHYRARVIGGTFSVIPQKGGGTRIICALGREHSIPIANPTRASGKTALSKRTRSR